MRRDPNGPRFHGTPISEADLLAQLEALVTRPHDPQGVFADNEAQRLERMRATCDAIARNREAAARASAESRRRRMAALAAGIALALAVVGHAPSPAAAQEVGVSFTIGAHARNDHARCTNPVRVPMYAAQAADALTAGAAASHGGYSRTPFGASPTVTFAAEEAAFDLIVGALTRRASCGAKNLVDGVLGASALSNALRNNSVSR